eukprot:s2383_g11.t1
MHACMQDCSYLQHMDDMSLEGRNAETAIPQFACACCLDQIRIPASAEDNKFIRFIKRKQHNMTHFPGAVADKPR